MKKTDESVKAGLEIETNRTGNTGDTDKSKPAAEPLPDEKDEDELVHERAGETPDITNEQDMDELVHKQTPPLPHENSEEVDGDDAVHSQ